MAFYYGDFELCDRFNNRALDIAKANDDKQGMADSYTNLCITAFMAGDYEGCIAFNLKGLALFEELGETRGVALIQNNLGMAYQQLEQVDKAEEAYKKSMELTMQIQDLRTHYNTQVNLGFMMLDQNPYSIEARHYIYRAILRSQHRPLSIVYLEGICGLAHFLYHDGDYTKSAQLVACLKVHPHVVVEIQKNRLNPLIDLYKHLEDESGKLLETLSKGDELDFEKLVTEVIEQYAIYE